MSRDVAPRSMGRLFAVYAVISLAPVIVLGVALSDSYRSEAQRRGLAAGRAQAALVSHTAVEPLLDGHPLTDGLSPDEEAGLDRLARRAVESGTLLRFRVRDLDGRVVFSDDGSGMAGSVDDEALEAAAGEVISELTHVNTDANDEGAQGPQAVEVYLPVSAGDPAQRVGILEAYLPYAPISNDIGAGLDSLYRDLGIGLLALYLALVAISASVSRRLRRQVLVNAHLAEHDTLTDLPNRSLFQRRAEDAVAAADALAPVALAIIDLDRFKEVNDTLGHANGDQLLVELGRRLSAQLRRGDTIARLGGDEFGVILRDTTDVDATLRRLRLAIEHDVDISGLPLSVEASIGYVLSPADGTDVGELLQRADMAMYVAKAQHSGVMHYLPEHDHYDAANLALVAELRHAIDEGQLVLHYQPKESLADGRVDSVEALLRWQHPVHGLLYPGRFLPLAERTDLIDRLTEWVLRTALSELRHLDPLDDELAVAVNVSARSLSRADFASRVAGVLEETGVEPTRLIIEITETALMVDPVGAAHILTALDSSGVRISLDDFGCGQTSLGYLSTLPISELKIDQSFVADMLVNPAHAAIVHSIVDLGHNLALHVIGEGVESDAVLGELRATGCDVAQGYVVARPMPVQQLAAWLSRNAVVAP